MFFAGLGIILFIAMTVFIILCQWGQNTDYQRRIASLEDQVNRLTNRVCVVEHKSGSHIEVLNQSQDDSLGSLQTVQIGKRVF